MSRADSSRIVVNDAGTGSESGTPLTQAVPDLFLQTGKCLSCSDPIEEWWSYCAMCGYHIAGGALVFGSSADGAQK